MFQPFSTLRCQPRKAASPRTLLGDEAALCSTLSLATIQRPASPRALLSQAGPILIVGMALITSIVFQPRQASAGALLVHTMMEQQGEELLMLGIRSGPDGGSPLNFSSTVDDAALTYSFTLDSGSTYLGQSITLTGSGVFDSVNNIYDWSASGSLGAFNWTSVGTLVWSGQGPDPNGQSSTNQYDSDGNKISDMHDFGTVDLGNGLSTVMIQATFADGSNNGQPSKEGDAYDDDDGKMKYNIDSSQFGFIVSTVGQSPPGGGIGSSTAFITSVPEPHPFVLISAGMIAYGIYILTTRLISGLAGRRHTGGHYSLAKTLILIVRSTMR